MRTWIEARDKPALLLAVMKELAGKANISFEGDLSHLELENIENSRTEETEVLVRHTSSPVLDFIVLPLTEITLQEIWHELSRKDHLVKQGIVHVQIESEGELAFGGYDNFHSESTIAYAALSMEFIVLMKELGVIRGCVQLAALPLSHTNGQHMHSG